MATSRSLGQLTIDLIARISGFVDGMSKAERAADRSQKKIATDAKKNAKDTEDAWKGVGAAITTALGSIALGSTVSQLTGIAKETANLALEFDKLSALSGTSNEGFQRMAAGASTVGISAEKLADIFKDVQDKAGEFAQTGGGGMKDFFENIAPKIGVTIDQFRRLSGPEALQLYVSGLEKAKLSHQDMIFYMEGIASDSAMLLPLLQSNGAEWERLGKAAEDAGAIMGDKALQAARDYKVESQNLERAMQGLRIEVMEQLLPSMSQFTNTLSNEATRTAFGTLIGWMGQLASTTVTLTANLIAFINTKDRLGAMTGTDEFGKMTATAQGATDRVARLTDAYERHQTALARDPGNVHLQRSVEKTRGLITQATKDANSASDALKKFAGAPAVKAAELVGPPGSAKPTALSPSFVPKPKGGGGKSQAEKDYEAADKYLKALDASADGRKKMTAYEQVAYDLSVGKVKMTERQKGLAEGQATAIDMAAEAEELRGNAVARNTALYEAQERVLSKTAEYQQLLSTYGMGDKENSILRERVSLIQSQQVELRKMAQDQAAALGGAKDDGETDRLKARYDDRLALIKEAQEQELQLFDQFQSQKKEMDGNWLLGAQSAINTYIEKTQDSYAMARDYTTSMMGTIEGAFVQLFTRGEASFKDFAASIVAGMAQIAAQQAASGLVGLLGSAIGGGFSGTASYTGAAFGGYRATGGPVDAGSLYRVNELGPEMLNMGGKDYLMMGGARGYVKPLGAATPGGGSGGGGLTVNVPIAIDMGGGRSPDPAALENVGTQLSKAIKPAVQEEVARMMRPGGMLWAQSNGR